MADQYLRGGQVLMTIPFAKRTKEYRLIDRSSILYLFILFLGFWGRAQAQVPPAPAFLATALPLNGQVNLVWTPNAVATSYAVGRQLYCTPTDTPTGPVVPTATPLPTNTPLAWVPYSAFSAVGFQTPVFTDYQVTDGQPYVYSVWGVNASGQQGLAAQATVAPFTVANAVNPTVQNIHDNSLDLSWSIPLSTYPIVSYNIYRQTSASTPTGIPMPAATVFVSTPAPIIATVTTPGYVDQNTPVSGATAIYYEVVAVDSQGVTGAYPTNSTNGAFPLSTLPPVAPTLTGNILSDATGTVTPTITPSYGMQLVWNGPLPIESVTNYQVLSNSTVIANVPVGLTVTPTYVYMDRTILPAQAGEPASVYSIVAMNANSPVTSNTFNGSITRPSMNGGMKVTPNATGNSVTITWASGNGGTYGLTGYRIYESDNGAPSAPYINTPSATTPTFTITPTPFFTIAETPSITPTLIVTFAASNVDHTYWVEPYYVLQNNGLPMTLVGDTTSLKPPLAPTPVQTININAVPNTNNEVNVSWTGSSPGFYGSIQNYGIYVALNGGTPTPVATVSASRTSRNTYTAYSPGSSATYFVGAIDALGNVSDLTSSAGPVALQAVIAPQTPQVLPSFQTATGITLRWLLNPASDNVTSYNVFGSDYYSVITATGLTPSPTYVVQATATPLSVSAPANWASTTYYVEAVNGPSNLSSQPATLSAIDVPNYSISAVVPAQTQAVSVSWNVTPPAVSTPYVDSLVIYRASATPVAGGDVGYRAIATVAVATPYYVDNSALPGVSYSYFVTARSNFNGVPASESAVTVNGINAAAVTTWPNAPTNLNANTGSIATTLTWSINPTPDGVTTYTVYRNGVSSAVLPAPTKSAIFGETPGVVSVYQVFANNISGVSNSSVTLSVIGLPSMTPVLALTPPAAYTPVSSPTPGVWVSGLIYPGTATDYSIYRSTDPTFSTWVTAGTVTSPVSFFFDPSAYGTGSMNYYKVVADNGQGVTANFTLSGILGINVWPNAPSSFTASAGSSSITLNWSRPVSGTAPVTAYDVYRGLSPVAASAFTPVATLVPLSSGPYVDTHVTAGTPYFYYMDAIANGLTSAPTTEVGAVAGPALALSGAAGVSQGILTWSQPTPGQTPGFSSYVVNRVAMPTPQAVPTTSSFTVSTINTSTYTDSTANYSTGYVYQVAPVAVATTGELIYGPYSNSVTLVVPPQGPTSLIAVSGDQLAQLRWSYQGILGAGAYTYTIQRKLGTSPTSSFQTIVSGLTGLDYTDTGLLDKTLYNYQVLAIDPKTTQIGYSPIANALPAKPPVVDNPTVTLVQSQNGNTLSWTAANSVSGDFNSATMYPLGGYHIYRSSDGGGTYQLLNPQGTASTSYTDNVSVINGTSYTYLVRAFDVPPNVSVTDPNMVHESTYTIVTANGLSASTALDRNSLRPFGAPNEQVVNIRFVVTSLGNVDIKVYSLSGTFVKELVNQSFAVGVYGIPGSAYPLQWDGRNANGNLVASGVYLITTEMSGHQEIDKIAVIK